MPVAQPAYSKHWHMLQTHDTRHAQLEHKARTEALASSMPVHNQYIQTLAHAANSQHTTHVAQAQGTYQGTCTTDFNKIEYIRCNSNSTLHNPRQEAPRNTYPYPYNAHTIYVLPYYTWSVSTRLVLRRLPVPSPLTTEDHNAYAQ